MPAEHSTHWERQVGSGLVYDGPCIVKALIVYPGGSNEYHDVYDGREAVSGTKFCRLQTQTQVSLPVNLGDGVRFGRGVYIDVQNATDEVTVCFIPL